MIRRIPGENSNSGDTILIFLDWRSEARLGFSAWVSTSLSAAYDPLPSSKPTAINRRTSISWPANWNASASTVYDEEPYSFNNEPRIQATLLRGIRTGRPAGSEQFIQMIERLTGRDLVMRKAPVKRVLWEISVMSPEFPPQISGSWFCRGTGVPCAVDAQEEWR